MEKKIRRNKGAMKIGCILMAVSLAVLNPSMSMVYANSDTNTDTEKKIVSENKTKSDSEKKREK